MPGAASGLPADLVELGRVVGAYGIRGWIKIEPYTAQSEVLLRVRQWWLGPPGPEGATQPLQASAARVVRSRPQGATIVAQLDGLETREQAAALRGQRVWISRAAFPAAADDEYYWVDLIGCLVLGRAGDDAQVLLGRVADVADNGAHAVLRVSRLSTADPDAPLLDAKGRQQETLIPFVQAHVHAVDLDARRIDTDWPPDF